jgi:hypothetical protein
MGFGGGHTRQKAEGREQNEYRVQVPKLRITYLCDSGKAGDIVSDKRELRPAHAGRSEVLAFK